MDIYVLVAIHFYYICELFKVSINHNYNGTQITYFNKKKQIIL